MGLVGVSQRLPKERLEVVHARLEQGDDAFIGGLDRWGCLCLRRGVFVTDFHEAALCGKVVNRLYDMLT